MNVLLRIPLQKNSTSLPHEGYSNMKEGLKLSQISNRRSEEQMDG